MHFLDQHSGGIQAIATTILVILTGIYVWLNKRLADATAQLAIGTNSMVSEMARQWRATQDADVWARYAPSDYGGQGEYYFLIVENLGPGTAFNIRFVPNPGWSAKAANGASLGQVGMISNGIRALGAGQQRSVQMKWNRNDPNASATLDFKAFWRNALGDEKEGRFELRYDSIAHESEVRAERSWRGP
jgi:hypothetical protein